MIKRQNPKHKHITSFQIIILGFLSVIILGSILLMLPVATRDGKGAVCSDALFTATSAVCVTGFGYTRYRYILVNVRAERNTVFNSNRRYGYCHGCGFGCGFFRSKNRSNAEKYYAGGSFCTSCRRHCAAYKIYIKNLGVH